MVLLFEPLTLRGVTTRNRIWIAAMCQYSANQRDGQPGDWHLVNLGKHATGGFGLIMTEATAVAPEGRISPEDTGIWGEEHVASWRRITNFLRDQGAVPAIQLAHAGRKASTYSPFADQPGTVPEAKGGWTTVSSTHAAVDGLAAPRVLSRREVAALPGLFAAAAARADRAGFDVVEIHAASGYLIHQFLSPLINDRTDQYGGSFAARTRLAVEIADAVREVLPSEKPLLFRLPGNDIPPGGWDVAQTSKLAAILKEHGVDLIDVSSGGAVEEPEAPVSPGYQVPLADEVRRVSGLPVSVVGLITEPVQAELVLASGAADALMVARAPIREPAWVLRAAYELGVSGEHIANPPTHRREARS